MSGTHLPSEPGEFVYGMEGRVLRCLWHGWEFDVSTGESVTDPSYRVATYPASDEDGSIFIEIDERRASRDKT